MGVNSGHFGEELEKMLEDPEYMKQQIKAGELAMQKIENIPGGLSQINSYYESMHDSFKETMEEKRHKRSKFGKEMDSYNKAGIKGQTIQCNSKSDLVDYIF